MSDKSTEKTSEQIYKGNKKKAKLFKTLSVISFYVFLVLTFIFLGFMLRNSIGNITDILHKLDGNIYTGEEIIANYNELAARWGEWEIIGASVRYIDIGNALFSGLMITYSTLAIVSICLALILGKMIFPLLKKYYENTNEEMVDLATLKSASQIDELTKKKKEWF